MFHKHDWQISNWGHRQNIWDTAISTFFDVFCLKCGKSKRKELDIVLDRPLADKFVETQKWQF
jgi:hypothetical protein